VKLTELSQEQEREMTGHDREEEEEEEEEEGSVESFCLCFFLFGEIEKTIGP
jgi:hypothetical protein